MAEKKQEGTKTTKVNGWTLFPWSKPEDVQWAATHKRPNAEEFAQGRRGQGSPTPYTPGAAEYDPKRQGGTGVPVPTLPRGTRDGMIRPGMVTDPRTMLPAAMKLTGNSWDRIAAANAKYVPPVPEANPLRSTSQREFDWRKATLGPTGEELPEGAVGWTPEGKPYFGPGIVGGVRKWLSDINTKKDELAAENAGVFPRAFEALKLGYRLPSEMFRGVFTYPGQVAERGGPGTATALQEMTEGQTGHIGLLDLSTPEPDKYELPQELMRRGQTPTTPGDLDAVNAATGEWLRQTAVRAGNIAKTIVATQGATQLWNASLAAYNTLKTGKWRETNDEYANRVEAGRVLYTSLMDPMVREEYIKAAEQGYDPARLALELESPMVEAIGQSILDPLNFIGMPHRGIKAAEHIAIAEERLLNYSPELVGIAKRVRLGELTAEEAAPLIRALADAARESSLAAKAARAAAINKGNLFQRIVGSLFSMTAETRRGLAANEAGDLLGWIASTAKNKTHDDIVGIMAALAKTASPSDAARAEGIAHLLGAFDSPLPLFSAGGQDVASLLWAMVGKADGTIDSARLLDGLEAALKSTDPAAVAKWAEGLLGPALKKAMPTMTDAIEASERAARLAAEGKDVPEEVARLAALAPEGNTRWFAKADKAMQTKFYRPVNTVLSAIYMGYSPGYAMRNGIQNIVHYIIDEGASNPFRPQRTYDEGLRWTGGFSGTRATAGITVTGGAGVKPVAETTSLLRKIVDRPFQRVSQAFETATSKSLWGRSVERTMRRLLVPGRALPDVQPLIAKGMSEETAGHLTSLVLENRGDVKAAVAALRQELAVGGREAWRSLPDLLSPQDLKAYEGVGLRSQIEEAIAGATGPQEAKAAIQKILSDVQKQAERVLLDHAVQETGSEAALLGRLGTDDLAHATIDNMMVANENAVGTVQGTTRRILEDATEQSLADPVASAAVREIRKKYAYLTDAPNRSFWTAFKAARNERAAAIQAVLEKTDNAKKIFGPDELAKMWRQAGVTGPPPANLTRQTFRDGAFAILQDESYSAYNTARDMMYAAQIDMMRELRALGLDFDPKYILEADQAVKYAQEVSSAAILKDGKMWAWKDIAGSLVGDIDTPQHLLNAINRYLPEGVPKFGRLGDVPPQVAVDALQGRAAVKAGGEAAVAARVASDALMETPAYRADAILANLTGFEAVPGGGQHVSSMAGAGFASADEADEVARVLTEQGFQPERFVTEGGQEGVRVRVPAKDVDAARAAANARIEASVVAEQGRATVKAGGEVAEEVAQTTATLRPVVPPYSQGSAPSGARVLYNQLPDINELFGRTLTSIDAAGDRVIPMIGNPELDSALTLWEKEGVAGVAEARLVANKVGIAERDFALHNYAERYGFDHALAYIYPYQFWYTRTYAKWLQRIAASPGIVSNYARYKDALGKMHADLPPQWRYSINSDELLGIQTDHPLFFNLEATLNPVQGLTGVDYYDTKKRVNWWTSTLDNLGKFGPNTWTPISIATAIALYNKDQEASARWAGRLFPQSATLRPVISAIAGKPVEIDPWVLLFSGGIDPYERSRVGRALGAMVNEKEISEEAAIEAARVQQDNPIWQQGQMRAMNERFPGQLSSFVFGAGFRMRTQSDVTIDQFWTDYNLMWTKWPDMSPQKKVDTMDWMRREYPFMDTILLSRKTGVERDTTYAYNVMARIPPGKSDDYMEYVGASRDFSNRFYEDGGDISKWSETDRMRFMAAIVDIGAMLNLPQDATKQKWNAAKVESDKMYSAMESAFGADIMDRVSAYWTLQDENPTEARKMLTADPAIGQAQDYREQYIMSNKVLVGYYGTLSTVENYWKGYMKEQAEKEFGEGTLLEVAEYESIIDPVAKKEYKKEHPRIKQFYDFRDEWNSLISARIVEFGSKLGEGQPELSGAEPASSGQEQLLTELADGAGQLPQISWAEWQDVLGESLSNLVADYALYGEPIPEAGVSRIGAFGRDMGASSNDMAVEMAAWAVLQAEQEGQ